MEIDREGVPDPVMVIVLDSVLENETLTDPERDLETVLDKVIVADPVIVIEIVLERDWEVETELERDKEVEMVRIVGV